MVHSSSAPEGRRSIGSSDLNGGTNDSGDHRSSTAPAAAPTIIEGGAGIPSITVDNPDPEDPEQDHSSRTEGGNYSNPAASPVSRLMGAMNIASPGSTTHQAINESLSFEEKTKMERIQLTLLLLGGFQLLASAAFTVVIRVYQAVKGCADPTDFESEMDWEKFKETGNMCYLGYTLLLVVSWSPQLPMAVSGPLNIVCGIMHFWIVAIGGVFLHSLVTFGMLGVWIAMLATEWPFVSYCFPGMCFLLLSFAAIPLIYQLIEPFHKIHNIEQRLHAEERERRRLERESNAPHSYSQDNSAEEGNNNNNTTHNDANEGEAQSPPQEEGPGS